MGAPVITLEDLFPRGCRAVIVGVNPAPTSVARGHYYQGTLGQNSVLPRLRQAGLVPDGHGGQEDDGAMELGLGFTDIVKRPTSSASEVHKEEFEFGRPLLKAKLTNLNSPLVIFSFKKVAERYFRQDVAGFGFLSRKIGDSGVFLMPGPMAPKADGRVQGALDELKEWACR